MADKKTKGPKRAKVLRTDMTLGAKLDALKELETRLGRDFDEAKSILKEYRDELIEEANNDVVEGGEEVVGSDKWYLAQANIQHGSEGSVEIDDNAVISRGDDPGAYVQGWLWVPEGGG